MTTPEGYESLSEIRLRAKRSTLLALLLGDTRLQPATDADGVAASFIVRLQRINKSLPGYVHIQAAYGCLSHMSVMNEQLTFKARYSRGGEGGLSRTAQYLRYLMAQMEQLRMIKVGPAAAAAAAAAAIIYMSFAVAKYFCIFLKQLRILHRAG
ncbi:hypothetical protein COO60DRAFT_1046113 [Scenedesmus sp. NREL 46B-D3]|nr:hypothetical protein COO60DRAFT_1046113 [Scenedesmus sp. NREL 46B-D3]